MKGPTLTVLLIALAGSGCAASPLAPDVPETVEHRSMDGETITMSGWVYEMTTWADPPLADAVVEVTAANGVTTSVSSDARGYYELTVPRTAGPVSIRAAKNGYLPKSIQVTLVEHTVLNFFLSPI
jgi:hypothetical protein